MNRKICVVITARASYSRIRSLLVAINKNKNLQLQIVVAASAILNRYGSILEEIKDDGITISATLHNVLEGETLITSAKTTGLGIIELSSLFNTLNPDIVITIADRYETMSTAIAASYMNIPLAHIQGGEVTGNIDEKVRHSITKLSDYHFVSSENSYKRVLKLGEDPRFIFNTGCPSIDLAEDIKEIKPLDYNPFELYKGVGHKFNYKEGYWVVMQHPVTTEIEKTKSDFDYIFSAVEKINDPVFWFWPNIDSGSDIIANAIRSKREKHGLENFFFLKNIKSKDFLKLLNNSIGIIGNSSVGIRECTFLGVPAINIGLRQNKRDRGPNVVDVDANKNQIFNAVNKIKKSKRPISSTIYGNGDSGMKIANILADLPLVYSKTITY